MVQGITLIRLPPSKKAKAGFKPGTKGPVKDLSPEEPGDLPRLRRTRSHKLRFRDEGLVVPNKLHKEIKVTPGLKLDNLRLIEKVKFIKEELSLPFSNADIKSAIIKDPLTRMTVEYKDRDSAKFKQHQRKLQFKYHEILENQGTKFYRNGQNRSSHLLNEFFRSFLFLEDYESVSPIYKTVFSYLVRESIKMRNRIILKRDYMMSLKLFKYLTSMSSKLFSFNSLIKVKCYF